LNAQAPKLPGKILIIDDDPAFLNGVEQMFARHQITVMKASSLDSALYLYNQNRFDVVLIELDFGPLPGLAFIQKWRQHDISEKRFTGFIVMASNQRNTGQDGLAKELEDIEIIQKPFKDIQILPVLIKAVAIKQKLMAFGEFKEKIVTPYLKSGNSQKAIDKVQGMIPQLGDKGRRLLLDIYEGESRWQDTLDSALGLLETKQNDINLNNTAGRMYMKLGKFSLAKPFIEKADQLAPQNINRLNELATLYLKLKEPDKSVERFKELVKLNPEQPDYKFEVFKKLYDAGYDEHAISFGKEVANPMEIVRHYNNKGVMLAKEGKISDAIEEYNRALKFYPTFKENYRIYYNLALAHLQLKTAEDMKKAEIYLTKVLELEPNFEKAKAGLAALTKAAS
jgi:tetratricopeptide (TPR) repeat protein